MQLQGKSGRDQICEINILVAITTTSPKHQFLIVASLRCRRRRIRPLHLVRTAWSGEVSKATQGRGAKPPSLDARKETLDADETPLTGRHALACEFHNGAMMHLARQEVADEVPILNCWAAGVDIAHHVCEPPGLHDLRHCLAEATVWSTKPSHDFVNARRALQCTNLARTLVQRLRKCLLTVLVITIVSATSPLTCGDLPTSK